MRLANHLHFLKFYKLSLGRCTWNSSLVCTISLLYYTSILLAKWIVKMKVPDISSVIWRAPVIVPLVTKVTEELKSMQ